MSSKKSSDFGTLVLGRREGESIRLKTSEGEIEILFLKTQKDFFRVAINAPKSIHILRTEVKDKDLDN